ncbi:arylesterase [Nitrospirillum iridis]|uniref:Acyl-CoA thioesterase-1 n=1 Tax=Nitrospirillum iridis TaxID=765888 RepID=A0A7X0B375_9PROT|nr:arylesterase [Nitrospirillum iridis]MBB6253596.1 acyl-CoA thioesterase-1 [Nitrospirillum iridis]
MRLSLLPLLLLAGLAAGAAQARPLKVVVLGDSLSAGYNLPPGQGLTRQLEAALRHDGFDVTVGDTAVSGQTSAGGLAGLDWMLGDAPDLVVVELGANDMLRGVDPKSTRANLDKILATLKDRHVSTILAGMKAQPNLGADYVAAFDTIYPDLAKRYAVPFYPFILDGVALDPKLTIADRMHPNGDGVAVMVRGLKPVVAKALTTLKDAAPSGK